MPATTLNQRVATRIATRLVPITPRPNEFLPAIRGAIGTLDVVIADGATVTATRVDQAGSASGTALNDDRGNVWATFASAIAAGTWDLAV